LESIQLQGIGMHCQECNLVFLHDQRGSAHFYTARLPWATYLRVYRKGQYILGREVNELNVADPSVLTSLVRFAGQIFPNTTLHLIYRGHSIVPEYDPLNAENQVQPFDYSDAETPYSAQTFADSIRNALPLSSITLAACRMSYLELISKLTQNADYFIATQHEVLETLSTGFDYQFILKTRDTESDLVIAKRIANELLIRFENVNLKDAMLEEPTSLVHLKAFTDFEKDFRNLLGWISGATWIKTSDFDLEKTSRVMQGLSRRYAESLRKNGKSDAEIASMEKLIQVPSVNESDRDLGLFLKALEQDPRLSNQSGILDQIRKLESILVSGVEIFQNGPAVLHSGISFQADIK
jgi:hypothetical protein